MSEAVVIIGAGAAGLMAASVLSESDRAALLLERGEQAGRKILASGGGRCNFTTERTVVDFLSALPVGAGRFLKHALHGFSPQELRDWFLDRGLESVVEDRRCVFPKSGRSRDVLAVLLTAARYKETLRTNCAVREICISEGRVAGVETSDGRRIAARAVIVATGGPAWPQAGGTSSGLDLLRGCGHTITELRAGLAPLITGRGWWRDIPGVTLEDVGLAVGRSQVRGPVVTAHVGFSGPAALDASLHLPALPSRVLLDLVPGEPGEALEAALVRAAGDSGGQLLRAWLSERFPRRVAEVLPTSLGIAADETLGQLRREDRRALVEALKRGPVDVIGLGDWRAAMVTVGGCVLGEVNPRTMESRIVGGLYVAGESLDVAAPTGGYNLHAAFATGRLAGQACVQAAAD